MSSINNVRVLDRDFPVELEAWEHNKEEWSKGNEGKYLVIRGSELVVILDTPEDMREYQEQHLIENPALIRLVVENGFMERFASYSGLTRRA